MRRIHIIGGKNHGKTTLIVDLVHELKKQGLSVGTIKHTHHHHELDTPGKDSHRHRDAGADAVGICSRSMNAVFWPPQKDSADREADTEGKKYAMFAPMFEHCDFVLVEGDSKTRAMKLEVWRSETGGTPIAVSDDSILAVVTDAENLNGVSIPLWPRSDVVALAKNIVLATRGRLQ
ncbi:MAG: molybdopterin-guanine dinucleotide biosynthesis protein B [Planctomycetaceae bacterium]|nr:molybdopterin-guanine dinucleotide biosynthesis protein B [Planctomycetaceae bacterium]